MTSLPFGSWPSPLSPAAMTAATRTLDEVRVDGPDTYWLESRPWNRPGSDKTWVLVSMTAHQRFMRAVRSATRVDPR